LSDFVNFSLKQIKISLAYILEYTPLHFILLLISFILNLINGENKYSFKPDNLNNITGRLLKRLLITFSNTIIFIKHLGIKSFYFYLKNTLSEFKKPSNLWVSIGNNCLAISITMMINNLRNFLTQDF